MPRSEAAVGVAEVVGGHLTLRMYANDFPAFYIGEGFEDLRHKCHQDVGIVSSCDEDHYSNIGVSQVLLIRDSLVKCDKDIKFIPCQGK